MNSVNKTPEQKYSDSESLNTHSLDDPSVKSKKIISELKSPNISHSKGFINGTTIQKQAPVQFIKPENGANNHYNTIKKAHLKSKRLKRKILTIIFVVIIMIVPPFLLQFDINTTTPKMIIDGEFEDWENYQSYLDPGEDQTKNPSADLIEIKIVDSATDMFIFASVMESMFDRVSEHSGNGDKSNVYSLYFFIDNDFNSETGYSINGLGADFLIKISGQNGIIQKSLLFNYINEISNNDWNSWQVAGPVKSALGGNMIEIQISKSLLDNNKFSLCAVIKDGSNNYDIFDNNIGFGKTVINVRLKNNYYDNYLDVEPLVEPGAYDLLELGFHVSGGNTGLERLGYHVTSSIFPEFHGTFEVEFTMEHPQDKDSEFEFPEPMNIPVVSNQIEESEYILSTNNQEHIELFDSSKYSLKLIFNKSKNNDIKDVLRISLSEKYFEFIDANIYFIDLFENIEFEYPMGYVGNEIEIDGSFIDWIDKSGNPDIDLEKVDNENIDLKNYKLYEDDKYISFYFSVKGILFSGTIVPELPEYNSETAGVIVSGSSNPSSESSSTEAGSEFGQKKLPSELLGEDKAYIFIDSDANIDTGYNDDWLTLGADYCFEITGKNGEIINRNLLKYSFNRGSIWRWDFIKPVSAAKDYTRLEAMVEFEDISITPGALWTYFIYISDWSKNADDAGGSVAASRAFPTNLPDSLNELQTRPRSNIYPAESSTRSVKIGNSTTFSATTDNSQYKLVRDSKGIWFAFWHNNNMIYAANSTSSSGTNWNTEFVLIGTNGKAVNTNNPVDKASVAVHIGATPAEDRIHLVCQYNGDDVLYTRLVKTGDFQNSSGSAWTCANESRSGFELLDGTIGSSIIDPVIAVNSTGIPHVIWTQNSFDSTCYYTKFSQTNWSNPVLLTYVSSGPGFGIATIDIDTSDNLHLAWLDRPSNNIMYKRCLANNDSTNASNWKSANQSADFDKVLFSANNLHYPSMVTDSNDNVWIIVHEMVVFDILYSKCINDNWSSPEKIATVDDLKYPSIGADSNGNVHAVWLNTTTNIIMYAYYSTSWSTNFTIVPTDIDIKYNPTVERHLGTGIYKSGIIYLNSTSKDISFEYGIEIPELPDPFHFVLLIAIIFIINRYLINQRREEKRELGKKK